MDVKFYPETVDYRKANSLQISFKGNTLGEERSTFIRISEEVCNTLIFVNQDMQENSIFLKLAQRLVFEKDANVLLMCKPYIFREIIKSSFANMEAHLRYDEQDNMIIYYAIIEGKQSVILTAFEEWD